MYYQQAQKIEVIVRKEGGNGEKGNKETDIENAGSKNEEPTGGVSKRAKRFWVTNLTHSAAVGKQFANAAINYWQSGLSMEYGDEAYQDVVGRQIEYVQDRLNFATSVAMGATYGSFGGVPGMAIGAVLGGASSIISTHFKYLNRHRDYNFKVFKENNAIEYKRARANLSLTNGRLR